MEPIDQVQWDLVLTGTGLAQSLLALSLSRSNKRILHVDPNFYYGGAEAALSLQDAEAWVKDVARGATPYFQQARILRQDDNGGQKLAFSRSYSLALAPQLIYTRSALISLLVSSKVYRQLEFMAVGAWWVYDPLLDSAGSGPGHLLRKIPSRREEIFSDSTLDLKAKRALIKFLRMVMDTNACAAALAEFGSSDLQSYLTQQFAIPIALQNGLHALTLSPRAASNTLVSYALPHIARHLGSFGVFGPGFSALVPKWGGLAEIAQVACRALAVGGGVYMLGTGITAQRSVETNGTNSNPRVAVTLDSGNTVHTTWISGSSSAISPAEGVLSSTRSITIVASNLSYLFQSLGEGAPKAAASVVVIPAGSLDSAETANVPVYLMVHSSETGECPAGQVIVYASVGLTGELAYRLLDRAVERLLSSINEAEDPETCIRWKMEYQQHASQPCENGKHDAYVSTDQSNNAAKDEPTQLDTTKHPSIRLPAPSLDLAFDDACLDPVRAAWHTISGSDRGFLEFEDREAEADNPNGDDGMD